MTTVAFAENVAGGNIECRKQARNAVSLVVVRASLQLSSPHGQHRLGSAQSLDLGFLIHAQDEGMMGWIEIQPDNIPHFVDQQGIARQLKILRAMRFQTEGSPDAADGGLAQSG